MSVELSTKLLKKRVDLLANLLMFRWNRLESVGVHDSHASPELHVQIAVVEGARDSAEADVGSEITPPAADLGAVVQTLLEPGAAESRLLLLRGGRKAKQPGACVGGGTAAISRRTGTGVKVNIKSAWPTQLLLQLFHPL